MTFRSNHLNFILFLILGLFHYWWFLFLLLNILSFILLIVFLYKILFKSLVKGIELWWRNLIFTPILISQCVNWIILIEYLLYCRHCIVLIWYFHFVWFWLLIEDYWFITIIMKWIIIIYNRVIILHDRNIGYCFLIILSEFWLFINILHI